MGIDRGNVTTRKKNRSIHVTANNGVIGKYMYIPSISSMAKSIINRFTNLCGFAVVSTVELENMKKKVSELESQVHGAKATNTATKGATRYSNHMSSSALLSKFDSICKVNQRAVNIGTAAISEAASGLSESASVTPTAHAGQACSLKPTLQLASMHSELLKTTASAQNMSAAVISVPVVGNVINRPVLPFSAANLQSKVLRKTAEIPTPPIAVCASRPFSINDIKGVKLRKRSDKDNVDTGQHADVLQRRRKSRKMSFTSLLKGALQKKFKNVRRSMAPTESDRSEGEEEFL